MDVKDGFLCQSGKLIPQSELQDGLWVFIILFNWQRWYNAPSSCSCYDETTGLDFNISTDCEDENEVKIENIVEFISNITLDQV